MGRERPGPSAVARPQRHSGPFADSPYDLLSCKMGGDGPGMKGQRKLDFSGGFWWWWWEGGYFVYVFLFQLRNVNK